jgi:hypothetical protein
MLIVYTTVYLKKLWTMYEFAAFLTIRSSKEVTILSTDTSKLILLVTVCMWIADLVFYQGLMVLYENTLQGAYEDVYFFFLSTTTDGAQMVALSVAMRQWARSREKALAEARAFRVGNAECAVEADRPFVNRMIVMLVKALKLVGPHEAPENALSKFEELVHVTLPPALLKRFGTTGLPYKLVLIVNQVEVWNTCDQTAAYYAKGHSFQKISAYLVYKITYVFVVFPATVRLAGFIATRRLDFFGWRQAAIYAVVFITAVPCLCGADWLLACLFEHAGTSPQGLGIMTAVCVFLLVVVYALYRPCHQAKLPLPLCDLALNSQGSLA